MCAQDSTAIVWLLTVVFETDAVGIMAEYEGNQRMHMRWSELLQVRAQGQGNLIPLYTVKSACSCKITLS